MILRVVLREERKCQEDGEFQQQSKQREIECWVHYLLEKISAASKINAWECECELKEQWVFWWLVGWLVGLNEEWNEERNYLKRHLLAAVASCVWFLHESALSIFIIIKNSWKSWVKSFNFSFSVIAEIIWVRCEKNIKWKCFLCTFS